MSNAFRKASLIISGERDKRRLKTRMEKLGLDPSKAEEILKSNKPLLIKPKKNYIEVKQETTVPSETPKETVEVAK